MNENVCGYEITVGQEEEERINLARSGRTDARTDGRTDGRSEVSAGREKTLLPPNFP